MCCAKSSFVRRLLIVGVLLAVGTYVYRNTETGTYVRAVFSQMFAGVGDNMPTKTEIAALEQQISDFEQNVRGKVGPISALKVKVEKLEEQVTASETILAERNKAFLTAMNQAEGDSTFVGVAEANTRAKTLYQDCLNLEQNLDHKRKELAHEKGTLEVKVQEFDYLNGKLQEFRAVLAEFREREAQLDYTETTTDPNSPERKLVEQIQKKRQLIQDSQKQREYAMELNAKINPTVPAAAPAATTSPVSLEEMRTYANGIRATAKND
jgi:regulator of replication initiation timing